MRITYMTDVEGNWEYFLSYVSLSEGLELDYIHKADKSAEINLKEGWAFVFGGDVCDKGGVVGGSIRVTISLIRMKRKYPERVTLILGNRDINKMRITSELAPSQIARLEDVPGPYWVPAAKRVSPFQFLQGLVADAAAADADLCCDPPDDCCDDPEKMAAAAAAANTAAHRLRWMLDETMGAAGEFERRRSELCLIREEGWVTDEEVFGSMRRSVDAGGFMRDFLKMGVLAAVKGPTLFVHGGIVHEAGYADGSTDCLGYVPGVPQRFEHVSEWVAALNAWKEMQLAEWMAQPEWEEAATSLHSRDRGGNALMDYVVPGTLPSVIISRHLDGRSMPVPMAPQLAARLNASGIFRMVVGHIPHGSCPTVIKSGGPEMASPCMEIIMADTSYSNMDEPDNRGAAVSDVVLNADGSAVVRGKLEDGERIAYELLKGVGPPSELVGQIEPDAREIPPDAREITSGKLPAGRRFVKAYLPRRRHYLMCNVDGFRYTYERMQGECVRLLLRHTEVTKEGEAHFVSPASITRLHSHGDEHSALHEHAIATVISDIFAEIDSNKSGLIAMDELQEGLAGHTAFLKLLGPTASGDPFAVGELLAEMETSGSGEVSFDDFSAFLLSPAARRKLRTSSRSSSRNSANEGGRVSMLSRRSGNNASNRTLTEYTGWVNLRQVEEDANGEAAAEGTYGKQGTRRTRPSGVAVAQVKRANSASQLRGFLYNLLKRCLC